MTLSVLQRLGIIPVAALVIQACSSVPATRVPPPVVDQGIPAPADQRVPVPTRSMPAPVPGRTPPARPQPAAVVALLDHAEQQANAGDLGSAAASLERALRIDPRNPVLWHHLATVRLAQGQAAQAEQLAVKSNSLASGNVTQQALNWQLIARARQEQGDASGAARADHRARELEAR
ncbi:MAG: tetratricopeptide repeat protein [Gammaproteobacteria bacterium]